MNLYNYIFQEKTLDKIAIIYKEKKITYRTLIEKIEQKSKEMPEKCEVVCISEIDSLNIIISLFAALKSKKKVILLNPNTTVESNYCNSILVKDNLITVLSEKNLKSSEELVELSLLTSGTTGTAKICPLPMEVIINKVNDISEEFLYDYVSVNEILAFPAHSITALTIQILPTLLNKGTLLIVEQLNEISDYMENYKVNFIGLTPTIFNLLYKKTPNMFNEVDCVFLGGEPIVFNKVKQIAQSLKYTQLIIGYGLTEGVGVISYGNILELPDRSVGRIWNKAGVSVVGDGKIGEIRIKNTINGEWICTGDIGYIEQDYLFIVDRKKSVIIVSGNNVFPNEIKQKILTIANVEDLIVYGISHPITGEAVAVDVITKMKHIDLVRELKKILRPHEFPKKINYVTSLGVSSSGKRTVKLNEKVE